MTITVPQPARGSRKPAEDPAFGLSLGTVLGPVAFTLAWLVLGFVSTGYTLFGHEFTEYSPISQSISGLGMGGTAAYMNTAFVVTGVVLVVGLVAVFRVVQLTDEEAPARGTRTTPPRSRALRRSALTLLACTGLGQILCGLFTLEAFLPHLLGFLLAVGTPVIGFPVAGHYFRTVPSWHRFGTWLRLGGPLALVLLVAYFLTFRPTPDGAEHGIAGLVQRLGVLHVHAWFVAMGWRAWRARRTA
ncbi:hypothetical protein GCM10010123_09580 [Pilimelia anulata]|uniref:DUF998 domain-containing protein n=1 Tax=Pilimelia anulata TaxID=53371 RepID=A0A8J3B050_9ACTN|nr:DUF998 domain-containing protein [Pilimelia anulata]GGJ81871.1 hypothetical protein GCM10010123_09580 [Pilimelia anulata]